MERKNQREKRWKEIEKDTGMKRDFLGKGGTEILRFGVVVVYL